MVNIEESTGGRMQIEAAKRKQEVSAVASNDGLCAKMTIEEILEVFKNEGMRIELGAQYSVKGQIAQLINGLKRLGITGA